MEKKEKLRRNEFALTTSQEINSLKSGQVLVGYKVVAIDLKSGLMSIEAVRDSNAVDTSNSDLDIPNDNESNLGYPDFSLDSDEIERQFFSRLSSSGDFSYSGADQETFIGAFESFDDVLEDVTVTDVAAEAVKNVWKSRPSDR